MMPSLEAVSTLQHWRLHQLTHWKLWKKTTGVQGTQGIDFNTSSPSIFQMVKKWRFNPKRREIFTSTGKRWTWPNIATRMKKSPKTILALSVEHLHTFLNYWTLFWTLENFFKLLHTFLNSSTVNAGYSDQLWDPKKWSLFWGGHYWEGQSKKVLIKKQNFNQFCRSESVFAKQMDTIN